MTEQKSREAYKKLWESLETVAKESGSFKRFKEGYFKYKEMWKEEFKDEAYHDTEYFVDLACRERVIPLELSHRLMTDFAIFVLLCRADKDMDKDAWLWKPKEWWFYFWKYYQVKFEGMEEEVLDDLKKEFQGTK